MLVKEVEAEMIVPIESKFGGSVPRLDVRLPVPAVILFPLPS